MSEVESTTEMDSRGGASASIRTQPESASWAED